MTTEELQQLLAVSGIESRVQRDEVAVRVCVWCGNERWNLELNAPRGLCHCWSCKRGGRLDTLLRALTGAQHRIPVQKDGGRPARPQPSSTFRTQPITADRAAEAYLAQRGIPSYVAAQYGMVICVEPEHRLMGRIVLPLRDFWTGEIIGWVGRSYTGKVPKYLSTLPKKVITGWRTKNKNVPAVVVEGPFDGIAVHRALFSAAVLSGVGGNGIVEWAARLPQSTPIVIMLDGDAAERAHQLYWEIAPLRGSNLAVALLGESQDPASLGPTGVALMVQQVLRSMGTTDSGKEVSV